jgi:hypothetical protein
MHGTHACQPAFLSYHLLVNDESPDNCNNEPTFVFPEQNSFLLPNDIIVWEQNEINLNTSLTNAFQNISAMKMAREFRRMMFSNVNIGLH